MRTNSLALAAAAIAMAAAGVRPEHSSPVRHAEPTTEQPPRQLSSDSTHEWFDPVYRRVGVRLNGAPMPNNVRTYDADAGWLETVSGRRLTGYVQPHWRESRPSMVEVSSPERDEARRSAAADKRARKAAKRLREQT